MPKLFVSICVLTAFMGLLPANALAETIAVRVLDKASQPLSGVVVYIEASDGQYDTSVEGKEVTISQKEQKFVPYIAVKSTNDSLVFENQDNITHHVYTVLSRDLNFRLREGQIRRDEKTQINTAGKTLMGCNIHDWMIGYIFTVDTPHYGKTDADGRVRFSLTNGKTYQARIWHPQMTESDNQLSTEITVTKPLEVTLRLTEAMAEIPTQEGDALFEFLEEYE